MKDDTELFHNLYDLEMAYLDDRISLDTYLNEYNRLIEQESDKMMQSDPIRPHEHI